MIYFFEFVFPESEFLENRKQMSLTCFFPFNSLPPHPTTHSNTYSALCAWAEEGAVNKVNTALDSTESTGWLETDRSSDCKCTEGWERGYERVWGTELQQRDPTLEGSSWPQEGMAFDVRAGE